MLNAEWNIGDCSERSEGDGRGVPDLPADGRAHSRIEDARAPANRAARPAMARAEGQGPQEQTGAGRRLHSRAAHRQESQNARREANRHIRRGQGGNCYRSKGLCSFGF